MRYPYCVTVEQIDDCDSEYNDYRRTIKKDEPHFDYVETFKKILIERTRRNELIRNIGLDISDKSEKEKYTKDLFGDAVLTNIKIANNEIMDPLEEEEYLKKLLKSRIKQRRKTTFVSKEDILKADELGFSLEQDDITDTL